MFLGVDLIFALLHANPSDGVFKAQANAFQMPVKAGTADAVIATAVIEHVPDATAMLSECARMLRSGGLLVVTTPTPFIDRLAEILGIWKATGHQQGFNLRQLRSLCKAKGLEVLATRKFMFSPIGFPFEKQIERLFGPLGLSLLMANQLLVARRV